MQNCVLRICFFFTRRVLFFARVDGGSEFKFSRHVCGVMKTHTRRIYCVCAHDPSQQKIQAKWNRECVSLCVWLPLWHTHTRWGLCGGGRCRSQPITSGSVDHSVWRAIRHTSVETQRWREEEEEEEVKRWKKHSTHVENIRTVVKTWIWGFDFFKIKVVT